MAPAGSIRACMLLHKGVSAMQDMPSDEDFADEDYHGSAKFAASKALSALIEYVLSEILEFSSIVARENHSAQVTLAHVRTAIESDQDLKRLEETLLHGFKIHNAESADFKASAIFVSQDGIESFFPLDFKKRVLEPIRLLS